MSAPSLPVTQWMGASVCVPTCSPMVSVYQAQAGPRSSYLEISSRVRPGVLASGGSWMMGVVSLSGWVRSMTCTAPEARPSSSAETWLAWVLDMALSYVVVGLGGDQALSGAERFGQPFCTDGGVDLGVEHERAWLGLGQPRVDDVEVVGAADRRRVRA